jgi:hypothetical protein
MPTPLSMNLRIRVLAAVATPRSRCRTSPPGWRGSCFCEPQSARTGGLRPSVAPRLALLAFKRPPPAHVGCHKRQKVRERIQWAGASLHCLPPYTRTSIRSRTPLPSSKPCCAKRTVDGLRTAIRRIVDLFVQTNVETTSPPQDTMQRDRLSAEGVAVLLPRKVEERAVLRQPVARLAERTVVFLQPGQT